MPVRLKNNARGLLAVSVTALDTVIRVRVGQGGRFPSLGDDEWFPLVLEDEQGNIEITRAIARSGDAITVRRAQDGTQAKPFPADTMVSLRITPKAINSWFTGEDPDDDGQDDIDYGGTGLIFNGLIVNAYHTEEGRQGYFHPNSGTSEGQYVFAGACYMAALAIQDYIDDHQPGPEVMTVTGDLPGYVSYAAYEGRLQINHSVGVCEVEQIDGDTLPPGYEIKVDNYSKEVVVKWPAYKATPSPVENGGFETGDTSGWTMNYIGGTGTATADMQYKYEGAYSLRFVGGRGTGSEGGIELEAVNNTIGKASPGFPVTANMRGMYNPLRHNKGCRYQARLHWVNEDGDLIGKSAGYVFIGRGNNKKWLNASVTGVAPAGASGVKVAAWLTSRGDAPYSGQAAPTWLDAVTWSVPDVVGTNEDDREFRLKLKVTDSIGQEAIWEGVIGEDAVYLTSHLYRFSVEENPITLSPSIIGFVHKNSFIPSEVAEPALSVSPEIIGFIHKDQPKASVEESLNLAPTIIGFIHKDQPKATIYEPDIQLSPTITGFIHKPHPNPTVNEPVKLSPTITGFVHE